MIYGMLHPGSGLGNQLHRYVATRVLALDKGYDFSMIGRENFKGKSFMSLDFGKENNIKSHVEYPAGKIVPEEGELWEEKTNYYNPEFNFIGDNTIIDGEFQDERYFRHRRDEIDKWLGNNELLMSRNVCVIAFRGGEYKYFPNLFLTHEYWDNAILKMRDIGFTGVFEVVTDDVEEAKKFFPNFKITHEIGDDWRKIRSAWYVILSNSSFGIFPAWLNQKAFVIAPKYWAGRNIGEWIRGDNYYSNFHYI